MDSRFVIDDPKPLSDQNSEPSRQAGALRSPYRLATTFRI